MTEIQIAPNLPKWMKDHVDRYLSSGGSDGHMYKITLPNAPELTVPSLLLITKGRKSGQKFLFPLFYGRAGKGYFVVASKGGAPEHPGWYRNLMANPDVEIQVGSNFGKLLQLYAVHKATAEARKKGFSVLRQPQRNGSIKLVLLGGAA